jgi:hypothetical protein
LPENLQGAAYLRFLQLAKEVRESPHLPALDPLEERMFGHIALASGHDRRLSVRDMMEEQAFGAPGTIHSRLKSMRTKGWVLLADTDDTRRKQVALTGKARTFLIRMSEALLEAARPR